MNIQINYTYPPYLHIIWYKDLVYLTVTIFKWRLHYCSREMFL